MTDFEKACELANEQWVKKRTKTSNSAIPTKSELKK